MRHGKARSHGSARVFALTLLPLMAVLACGGGGGSSSGTNTPNGGMSSAGSDAQGAGTSSSGAPGGGAAHAGSSNAGSSNAGSSNGNAGDGNGSAGTSGAGGGGAPNGGVAPVIAAGVRWFGRVDVSNPNAIQFAWTGSGFVGTFTGAKVSGKFKTVGNGDIFFQPVVDGKTTARFSVGATETTIDIATGLAAGEHRIELYRESEGKGFGYTVFSGFTAGTPGAPPEFSGRLIEVIGDSISAGFGNLGSEQHPNYGNDPNGGCPFTTETEAGYQAYSHVAARAVNADASVLAGSGWGIYSDNGGNVQNVMPNLFANTVGEQKAPAWAFAAKPQAVVINLGTNDSSAHNLTADKFKPAYTAFITTIRGKYPEALILGAVGSMMSGTDRTNAVQYITEISGEFSAKGDKKVKLLDLGTQDVLQGTGCSWHPNVAEDTRMGMLLATELKTSLGW